MRKVQRFTMRTALTKRTALTMRTALAALCMAGALAVSAMTGVSAARAQDEENATTYNFEDDVVSGDLVRPDGEVLNVRRRGNRSSLIHIRDHFIDEMLKSVEDL